VDLNGQVVGVNVAMVQGSQSIGFSIPVSVVNSALAKLGI
jgi:S1-C subfamily serine protease